jgi:Uma2 family endonuclease
MSTKPMRRPFTVAEYYRMGEAGILTEGERVELIEGEIVQMPPIGDLHAWCVNRLTRLFILGVGDAAVVSVQNPFRLSNRSEPVPDVVVMRPRPEFRGPHPTPSDVLLVIEVSDTTLHYDQRVKLPLYARELVPEVWIADLKGECIWVYSDPSGSGYGVTLILRRGDRIAPAAFPNLEVAVDDILG